MVIYVLRCVCVQVCEKEKLLTERNQLKACMGELWENFSCLSQEVCRDVQLSPEQVQSLHHYCPTTRPANAAATRQPKPAASPPTTSIDLTVCSGSATPEPAFRGSPGPSESGRDSAVRNGALRNPDNRDASVFTQSGLSSEKSNQTVTVDFCQEMTEKCTTDEQPRKDCVK